MLCTLHEALKRLANASHIRMLSYARLNLGPHQCNDGKAGSSPACLTGLRTPPRLALLVLALQHTQAWLLLTRFSLMLRNTFSFCDTCCVQVEQALRYAKAIRGQPDNPSLAMRHDEGLGGWTPLLLVQSVYALWDAILLSPAPPPEARGPCPAQGHQYALAVYHYTRCLALAAGCASANHTTSACSQAKEELHLLQVSPQQFLTRM